MGRLRVMVLLAGLLAAMAVPALVVSAAPPDLSNALQTPSDPGFKQ